MARYVDIADDLRKRVELGEWAVGEPLPSVRFLAGDYQVSIATALRAVQHLAAAGYVRITSGSGVVVIDWLAAKTPLRIGASIGYDPVMGYIYNPAAGDWAPLAMPTRRRLPARLAGARVMSLLGVDPSTTLLARHRVVGPDGTPEQVSTTWFAPSVIEQFDVDDTGPGGWMQQVEQPADVTPGGRDLGPLAWRCLVSSRPAAPDEATDLKLGRDAGVLVLTFPITPRGWREPIAVDVMVFDERRYEVEHPVPRSVAARWPVMPVPGRNRPLSNPG